VHHLVAALRPAVAGVQEQFVGRGRHSPPALTAPQPARVLQGDMWVRAPVGLHRHGLSRDGNIRVDGIVGGVRAGDCQEM
jgi:hypothetical protein